VVVLLRFPACSRLWQLPEFITQTGTLAAYLFRAPKLQYAGKPIRIRIPFLGLLPAFPVA